MHQSPKTPTTGCALILGLFILFMFVGCVVVVSGGGSSTSKEEGHTPPPAPVESGGEGVDTAKAILEVVLAAEWDGTSAEERDTLCRGWTAASGLMVDAYMEGFSGDGEHDAISDEDVRDLVIDFYDDKCS